MARGCGQGAAAPASAPALTVGLAVLVRLARARVHPCDLVPHLKLLQVVHNNLGNHGPDVGLEGIFYEGITGGTGVQKRLVDLRVTAMSSYQPWAPKFNGFSDSISPWLPPEKRKEKLSALCHVRNNMTYCPHADSFGMINIQPGTKTKLKFSLYDTSTKKSISLRNFSLTFFDLDKENEASGSESLLAEGFTMAYLSNVTSVLKNFLPDGSTIFSASEVGNGHDSPINSRDLSMDAKSKAVTLVYENIHETFITIAASQGKDPRVFMFDPLPALLCALTLPNSGAKEKLPAGSRVPGAVPETDKRLKKDKSKEKAKDDEKALSKANLTRDPAERSPGLRSRPSNEWPSAAAKPPAAGAPLEGSSGAGAGADGGQLQRQGAGASGGHGAAGAPLGHGNGGQARPAGPDSHGAGDADHLHSAAPGAAKAASGTQVGEQEDAADCEGWKCSLPWWLLACSAVLCLAATLLCCLSRSAKGSYASLDNAEDPLLGAAPWDDVPQRFQGQKVVVVLEKAALEAAKAMTEGKRPMPEDESPLMITHECLLTMLDSPLNKAGKLLIYLHSADGVLVEVHPSLNVPKSFGRFVLLVATLLRNGQVAGRQAEFPLMKVVPGPVEQYFPRSSQCYGLTPAGRPESLRALADQADSEEETCVFAIGASEGDALIEEDCFGSDYAGNKIAICPFGLKAMSVCQMVCLEYAQKWDIVPDRGS